MFTSKKSFFQHFYWNILTLQVTFHCADGLLLLYLVFTLVFHVFYVVESIMDDQKLTSNCFASVLVESVLIGVNAGLKAKQKAV